MKLFCPGPVNVATELQTKTYKEISHRGYDFQRLYAECSSKTKELFHDTLDEYTPLFLTGSGTLAIESMIVSWKGKGKMLLLQNGFFAEKWEALLKIHGIDYMTLDFGWGTPFCLDTLRKTLQNESFQAVFFVHHETSTTMMNPLEAINALCEEFSLDLFVDGVSSVGLYPIHLHTLRSLCMIGYSTNKCIGSYPGLAVVVAKTSFLQKQHSEISYLNLKLYYDFSLKKETPFTPCVLNFFYYRDSLTLLLSQPNRFQTYQELCDFLIQECTILGLFPYVEEKASQCCWVVNLKCTYPAELYDFLYKQDIVIYRCKGPLESFCIQIAIVNKSKQEIQTLLSLIACFVATKTQEGPKEIEGL